MVRAPQLGPSSLWLDDAWLALSSRADNVGELVTTGVTAPGFAVAVAAVMGLAGSSSLAAQALPFLLGVAAGPVLYLLGRRMGLAPVAAAVGAALVLAAPVHIVYSGRVKPFTADAVLVMIVLLAGWRVLERPAESRRWGWLALVATGSVMVSAAVATGVAGAYAAGWAAAWRSGRRFAPALASTVAFGVFAVVWWWAIIRPASTPSLRAYWAGFYLDDLAAALDGLAGGFAGLPTLLSLTVVAVAIVAVGRRRPLVAIMLVVPVLASVVLAALELAPFGGGRTDMHLYPELALLVATGLHLACRRWPVPATWVVPVAAGIVVAATLRPPSPYPAEDLRPLVTVVEAGARPDDVIAVYSASRWAYGLYTSSPVDLVGDPGSPNGFDVAIGDPRVSVFGPHRRLPARYGPEVAAITASADRVWLVTSHTRDDVVVLQQFLADEGFDVTRSEEREGASLALWERETT